MQAMNCRSDFSILDVDDELKTLTLICDTREQNTIALKRRLEGIGLPVCREKLDFADYSCRTEHFDFSKRFAVERKIFQSTCPRWGTTVNSHKNCLQKISRLTNLSIRVPIID